jgi:chromate transport protein ChrA
MRRVSDIRAVSRGFKPCQGQAVVSLSKKLYIQSLYFRQIYILSKTFSYINCWSITVIIANLLKFIVNDAQLKHWKNKPNVTLIMLGHIGMLLYNLCTETPLWLLMTGFCSRQVKYIIKSYFLKKKILILMV